MKRLIKNAIPRTKKKELTLTTKLVFEALTEDDLEAKGVLKLFKQWIKEQFVSWNDTILQHFLYTYNLPQDERTQYRLTMQIHKILKDESFIPQDLIDILSKDGEETYFDQLEDKDGLEKYMEK